jgi:hypothetical protein
MHNILLLKMICDFNTISGFTKYSVSLNMADCCSSPQSNIYLLTDGWMNGQTYFSKRNQDCLTWVFVSEYQMEMYFACNNFNYIGEIRVRQLDQTFIVNFCHHLSSVVCHICPLYVINISHIKLQLHSYSPCIAEK